MSESSASFPFVAKLLRRQIIGDDIYAIDFAYPTKPTDSSAEFIYKAGQYVTLYDHKRDYEPRSFSIANAPNNEHLHFQIRNTGRGLTQHLCADLPLGADLNFSAADGSGILHQSDKDIVLICGGTGYTAHRALLEQLVKLDCRLQKQMFIGARDDAALYMRSEIATFNSDLVGLNVDYCVENQASERVLFQEIERSVHRLKDRRFYIAGPPLMVIDIVALLKANGVAKQYIHYDDILIAQFKELQNKALA